MGAKLGVTEWEKILLNRAYGLGTGANAQDVGVSGSTVNSVLAAFDAVKDRDWAKACNVITTYDTSLEVFQWAAKKTGTTLPVMVSQAYDRWLEERRKKRLGEVKQKEANNAPPPSNQDEVNNVKALLMLLQAINKQNELLNDLMDVVIPKYVGDIKDNLNANFDVLNQSMKGCEDKLEAVKIALRKRGM